MAMRELIENCFSLEKKRFFTFLFSKLFINKNASDFRIGANMALIKTSSPLIRGQFNKNKLS